jgi:hypothetical protein
VLLLLGCCLGAAAVRCCLGAAAAVRFTIDGIDLPYLSVALQQHSLYSKQAGTTISRHYLLAIVNQSEH